MSLLLPLDKGRWLKSHFHTKNIQIQLLNSILCFKDSKQNSPNVQHLAAVQVQASCAKSGAYPGGCTPGGPCESLILAPLEHSWRMLLHSLCWLTFLSFLCLAPPFIYFFPYSFSLLFSLSLSFPFFCAPLVIPGAGAGSQKSPPPICQKVMTIYQWMKEAIRKLTKIQLSYQNNKYFFNSIFSTVLHTFKAGSPKCARYSES